MQGLVPLFQEDLNTLFFGLDYVRFYCICHYRKWFSRSMIPVSCKWTKAGQLWNAEEPILPAGEYSSLLPDTAGSVSHVRRWVVLNKPVLVFPLPCSAIPVNRLKGVGQKNGFRLDESDGLLVYMDRERSEIPYGHTPARLTRGSGPLLPALPQSAGATAPHPAMGEDSDRIIRK